MYRIVSYRMRWFTHLPTVAQSSTNWARRRVTLLTEHNLLIPTPIHQPSAKDVNYDSNCVCSEDIRRTTSRRTTYWTRLFRHKYNVSQKTICRDHIFFNSCVLSLPLCASVGAIQLRNICVLQGIVATRLGRGGIFYDSFIANFWWRMLVKESWKLVYI